MLVEFISTKFDEYEADRKKKDEMINSLEEKKFRIDWKSWQIVIIGWQTGTIFHKKFYSHTWCKTKSTQTPMHSFKWNGFRVKSEMYVEISPGDIDHTHRIGLLNKGEIVKFVRYMDRRQVFTKKRSWGERICQLLPIVINKIRMSAINEARNKVGHRSIWTAD